MTYTIKQVSDMTGISISTLRYYDNEGLFPNMERKESKYRIFTDIEVETLKLIECFKKAGLQIRDIKHYMELYKQGASTLQERYEIMQQQKVRLEMQQAELTKSMEVVDHKLAYYSEAMRLGSEAELIRRYEAKYRNLREDVL